MKIRERFALEVCRGIPGFRSGFRVLQQSYLMIGLLLGCAWLASPALVAQESLLTPLAAEAAESGSLESFQVGQDFQDPKPAEWEWLGAARVGYDSGFVIASDRELGLGGGDSPFLLRINGWGQLRQTNFESTGPTPDRRLFQLKRARLIFSGHAYTPDFHYYVQIDGRSTSGDQLRLLDYRLNYDIGHHLWGLDPGRVGFRTGLWKMPFNLARDLSGREFEFADRSVASMFFDVNRSLAWGVHGLSPGSRPIHWEAAIFNGLVTGGAETGSSGTLDNNFAYSGRLYWYPVGDWGDAGLADLECHSRPAVRMGCGFANSTIDAFGSTEFSRVRVVDSGGTLAQLFTDQNLNVQQYTVNMWAVDASTKWNGWSMTYEYYFRLIDGIQGAPVPDLFDHGHWLQLGKFVVPGKFELISRWSRVTGNSGTLGGANQSADEVAGGAVWYFRDQSAKLTLDATHINGSPVDAAALDLSPGDRGWLFRTQIQFAF